MGEKIVNIFNVDEQAVLSEIDREAYETIKKLPMELEVDRERMGEFVDE